MNEKEEKEETVKEFMKRRNARKSRMLSREDMDEDDEKDLEELEPDELLDWLIAHPEVSLQAMKDGLEHEKEHTDKPCIAARIAADHLEEDAAYYTKLRKIGG